MTRILITALMGLSTSMRAAPLAHRAQRGRWFFIYCGDIVMANPYIYNSITAEYWVRQRGVWVLWQLVTSLRAYVNRTAEYVREERLDGSQTSTPTDDQCNVGRMILGPVGDVVVRWRLGLGLIGGWPARPRRTTRDERQWQRLSWIYYLYMTRCISFWCAFIESCSRVRQITRPIHARLIDLSIDLPTDQFG